MMTQADYWAALEMRVCRELAGLREKEHRALWCDGFIPESFDLGREVGRVIGRVWIGIGSKQQQEWSFELFAGPVRNWEDLDWGSLLPAEDVTGWLSVNLERKILKIDPAAASPDSRTPHPDPLP
jgi:hypothetical protein